MPNSPHTPVLEMVDLKGQHARLKPELEQALEQVMAEGRYINGPHVGLFAQELSAYLGAEAVVPCGNGTDALQLTFMALGLKPGDEVLVPAFSYVAAAEALALLKLTPVFYDVDPHFFAFNAGSVSLKVGPKTKALLVVHLFGQAAGLQEAAEFARNYNLLLIEDVAQAIGAKALVDGAWHSAGLVGVAATTSFFPSKNLGCLGDGGAVYTKDAQLAKRVKSLANHGQTTKYVYDEIGCNSRLDTLQAAWLSVKLRHLPAFTAARQQAAAWYTQGLHAIPQVITPAVSANCTHVYHQYTIKVPPSSRAKLRNYLDEAGICSMVYYPCPLHTQPAFKYLGNKLGDFPVSETLSGTVLSLPMHTELTQTEVAFICAAIARFFSIKSK